MNLVLDQFEILMIYRVWVFIIFGYILIYQKVSKVFYYVYYIFMVNIYYGVITDFVR